MNTSCAFSLSASFKALSKRINQKNTLKGSSKLFFLYSLACSTVHAWLNACLQLSRWREMSRLGLITACFCVNALSPGFTDRSAIRAVRFMSLSARARTHRRRRGRCCPTTEGGVCLCVLLRDGGAAIKRQHAVSHEVLMPRISCSNVIHIPSAIQPARLMYESTRDFISTPPSPPFILPAPLSYPHPNLPNPLSALQPLLLLPSLHRTSPSVSECLCWLLSHTK